MTTHPGVGFMRMSGRAYGEQPIFNGPYLDNSESEVTDELSNPRISWTTPARCASRAGTARAIRDPRFPGPLCGAHAKDPARELAVHHD